MRLPDRRLLTVLIAAALVHAAALAAVRIRTGAFDTFAFSSLDASEYYTIAANLVDHAAFSQDAVPPFRPDTWRTPGYSFLLAGWLLLVGKSPTALLMMQQLLGVLSTGLLYLVAAARLTPRRAAIVTTLFLLEPYRLYYSTWLMSTTLQTALILGIWLAYEHGRRPILLGVLCGALVLTWPGAILIPFAILALLLPLPGRKRAGVRVGETDAQPRWKVPSQFALASLAVISTWMLRNYLVAGAFALSHQSGIVLAYFKAAEVSLWNEGRTVDRYLETSLDPRHDQTPHVVWDAIDRELRPEFSAGDELNWRNLAQGNRTELDSFQLSAVLTRQAAKMFLENPLGTMSCGVTRMGQILSFPLDLALAPPSGVTVNRPRSAMIGGAYLVLGVLVLIRLVRFRTSLIGAAFPLICTAALLILATPQTDPRFRVPMIPMLLMLALWPTVTKGDSRNANR